LSAFSSSGAASEGPAPICRADPQICHCLTVSAPRFSGSLTAAVPTKSMIVRLPIFKGFAALFAVQRLNTALALSALVEFRQ
jgi:hypothetical protein